MPEIHAASIRPPTPFLPFDGQGNDDDDFGDFEFAPSTSLPLPSPILVFPNSSGSHPIPAADDDDWGDFVSSPLGSRPSPFPDPIQGDAPEQPAPPPTPWEKPRGPLPLSIFGEAELVETHTMESTPFFGRGSPTSPVPGSATGESGPGVLKNLIANLYDQSDPKRSPQSVQEENGFHDGEFKIALSYEQMEEDGMRGDRHDQVAAGIGMEVVPNGMEYGTTGHHGNGKDLIHGHVQDDIPLTSSTSYSVAVVHKDLCSNMGQLECNGNGVHAIVSDADHCVDEESWGFKDAFSQDEVVAAFPVEWKIPETGAQVLTLTTGVKCWSAPVVVLHCCLLLAYFTRR